ncbi:MAG: anaerobic sulfatase maturase [Planctomycetaceae bacterium]|nr:anaerobic sulfatase maturase [Planctomycetaceae bacterium]
MTRPFTLLIKPAGPDCNLACDYCFYACKSAYFGGASHRMTPEVQEKLVQSYLGLGFEQSSFAWQGGEPTLMGLDFYKRLVELQKQYGNDGQIVSNALQTNGILLDDEWCSFLAEYKFLCGISLDGPQEYHDVYRRDRAGKGTFDRVMSGIEACRRNGAEFNILVLLNNVNVEHPDALFDFFRDLGIEYLQFVPCVEPSPDDPSKPAPYSITAEQYGQFLCRFFDRWMEYGIRKLSVRLFDGLLNTLLNLPPAECTFARLCSDYIVVEHNGDAYCCDFFVQSDTRLGNIMETPIEQLAGSPLKQEFARRKTELHNKCFVCRHLDLCRGGCPKDRLALSGTQKEPSYFCRGYKMFFDHALGQMQAIAQVIRTSANR